jgi:hypothetical protein
MHFFSYSEAFLIKRCLKNQKNNFENNPTPDSLIKLIDVVVSPSGYFIRINNRWQRGFYVSVYLQDEITSIAPVQINSRFEAKHSGFWF